MVQTKGEKEKSRRRKLRVTVKNNIILDYMLDEKNYLNLFFFWGGVFLRFLNATVVMRKRRVCFWLWRNIHILLKFLTR